MSRLQTVGLVLLLFVPFVLLELLVGSRTALLSPDRDHTSLNANPWGTMALYEVGARLALPVERWGAPYQEGFLRPGEVLLILDPQEPPRPGELRALWQAVRAGATVILAVTDPPVGAPVLVLDPEARERRDPRAAADLTLACLNLQQATAGTETRLAVPQAHQRGPLAGVAAVQVPSASRLRHGGDRERLREAAREAWGEEAALPVPETALAPETLLGDDSGSVLMRCPLGRGVVFVVSEVELFANAHLDQADNATLAVNLMHAAGSPRRVLFDEYHHGLRLGSVRPGELNYRAFPVAMGLAGLALVIFLSGYFWRFGRARPPAPPAPRSALEQVAALASLYRSAQAGGLAVGLIGGAFRQYLAERLGLPRSAPTEALAQAAGRLGLPTAPLAALLPRLDTVQEEDRLPDREVVRLVREISELEEALSAHGHD